MLNVAGQNLNYLWASLIVEELVRNGVDYFCIAPGSRSAPLAVAVAKNPRAKSFVHFDERGVGFHALGHASATGKPCAVITTSGTAVANLFPAVIEASKKKVPLVVLTADRPPELRSTGSHQTIDQVKIFSGYVQWQFDMPCPTTQIDPAFVLTTIDQAVARAQGSPRGPVHLNCMYREPLTPVKGGASLSAYVGPLKAWENGRRPYTRYLLPEKAIRPEALREVGLAFAAIKSGIIVVGKINGPIERQGVLSLAEKLGWPVFADVSSGLRFGSPHKNIVHYFDQILLSKFWKKKLKVDGVLHLGGRITSKRWYDFIEEARPRHYMMVLNHPLRNDPLHNVTLRIEGGVGALCVALSKRLSKRKASALLAPLRKVDAEINAFVEKALLRQEGLTEAGVARSITRNIPEGDGLFVANSLPIREVDMYADPKGAEVVWGANRGASGIDGIVATAAGFCSGLKKAVTLLIGDLALLHDLNSLSMLRDLSKPVVVVVLNNNGGGIFNLLPIAKFTEGFERYFATPHGLDFHAAADLFDLNYSRPDSLAEFVRIYKIALNSKASTVIEIGTDRSQTAAMVQEIQSAILKKIR